MSGKSGGSLATVLMSVPLIAIPLMAIFGIPQFTEVVASPDTARRDVLDPLARPGEPGSSLSSRERPSNPYADAPAYATRGSSGAETLGNPFDLPANPDDPTARQSALQFESPPGGDPAAPDWLQPPDAAGQGSVPITGHSVMADEAAADPRDPVSSAPGLTWRDATRRLQELGIDDYHLERGESFDSFLFVCVFEPAGTTNVVMRFEAEAGEPLAAVNDVLDQIDRWLRRSFAETRQAAFVSDRAAP